MYEGLHLYDRPRDEDVFWSYLDLSKLIYILANRALPFVRLDLLEDKFEGYIPEKDRIVDFDLKDIPSEERPSLIEKLENNHLILARDSRQSIFVNCWHINEHESAAMWKLHLKSPEGIAIRSTFGRLKESLSEAQQEVDIGRVRYIDYKSDRVSGAIMDRVALGMYKRKSFAHEQELRAVHWDGSSLLPTILQIIGLSGQWPSRTRGVCHRFRVWTTEHLH
jgi:hypothetical protein